MKSVNLLLAISIIIIGLGCSKKDNPESSNLKNKTEIEGTWVEKYPELFDGISDTITFTKDGFVEDYIYFKGWKYSVYNDTISIQRNDTIRKYMYSFVKEKENEEEIIIYNFLDRLITQQVKDIQFVKIK